MLQKGTVLSGRFSLKASLWEDVSPSFQMSLSVGERRVCFALPASLILYLVLDGWSCTFWLRHTFCSDSLFLQNG